MSKEGADLVERLAALPDLADVPRDQLAWLVEHGSFHREEDGYRVDTAEEFVGLALLVSGRFSVRVDEHGVAREVREITPGRVTGYLPYSRMTTPRGYLVADGPVEFLFIRKEDFPEMTAACYEFTAACVQEMLARVRLFKGADKQQEKMAALGRLSAGLAHELNNPASAVLRAARELGASMPEVIASARGLAGPEVDPAIQAALAALEEAVHGMPSTRLSPLDRAGAEDRLVDWLEDRGFDPDLAYPLVDGSVTVDALERASSGLDRERLAALLRHVAAVAVARGLEADIVSAAARIHSLVAAVKKHTHMDRAPAVEPIPVAEHLADAVTLMGSKAALKDVVLELTAEPDLPDVMGQVADLNQVWIHLIDNAIDAAPERGRVVIEIGKRGGAVSVCVVDNGPGIADEDRDRVFEPFFTTKDVSPGRGLGLDIVRTVVRTHRGVVDLVSRPGRTEFSVTLPAAGDVMDAP